MKVTENRCLVWYLGNSGIFGDIPEGLMQRREADDISAKGCFCFY